MKTKILMLALMSCMMANAQFFKIPQKERLFGQFRFDYAETKNPYEGKYGLNYGVEFGIRSYLPDVVGVEVWVGYETFRELVGGFSSFQAGFGLRSALDWDERLTVYGGIKFAKVYRTGPKGLAYRTNIGFETYIMYELFEDQLMVGLRGVIEERNDMDIFDWPVKNVKSVYVIISFNIFEL